MPHYVIHIGPHKTATTYLQAGFDAVRTELQAKGVLYPVEWYRSEEEPVHSRLVALLRRGEVSALNEQLEAWERPDIETVLLSCEDLWDLTKAQIRALSAALRDEHVTVVAYCRSWAERLASAWKEDVHHGGILTLPEFAVSVLTTPRASHLINFGVVVREYADAFGWPNVKLVSYNEVLKAGLNLRDHFLQTLLGVCVDQPAPSARVNVSREKEDVEIMRVLNLFDPTLGRRYMDARDSLDTEELRARMRNNVARLELDETDEFLDGIYKQLFAEHGYSLVEPRPRDRFFQPRRHWIDYISGDYLLRPSTAQELLRLRQVLTLMPAENRSNDPHSCKSRK
jgi:hypothetical protein